MALASVMTGFSLEDVAVATYPTSGGTAVTWVDVPAVIEAGFQFDVGEVEQWGDDTLIDVYYHSQKGTITVKGTKISAAVLEKLSGLTGSTYSSVEYIDIGQTAELRPPYVMVKAKIPARTSSGTATYMTAIWYKTTVKTVWNSIPNAKRAELQEVTLEFRTFASSTDHHGDALSASVHGRLFFGNLALT